MTESSRTTEGGQTLTSYMLITHDTEPRVLLLPHGLSWQPARLALPPGHFADVGPIIEAIRGTLGLDAVVLRTFRIDSAGNPDGSDYVYEVEKRSPGWHATRGGRWVGGEEAQRLGMELRALAPVIGEHSAGMLHPLRVP